MMYIILKYVHIEYDHVSCTCLLYICTYNKYVHDHDHVRYHDYMIMFLSFVGIAVRFASFFL